MASVWSGDAALLALAWLAVVPRCALVAHHKVGGECVQVRGWHGTSSDTLSVLPVAVAALRFPVRSLSVSLCLAFAAQPHVVSSGKVLGRLLYLSSAPALYLYSSVSCALFSFVVYFGHLLDCAAKQRTGGHDKGTA